VTLAELDFIETVGAGFLNVLFTAVFVGIVAAVVVRRYGARIDKRLQEADQAHKARLQEADQAHRARLQEADQAHEDRRREDDARHEERLREANVRHEKELQKRQLDYEARAALRETYAQLLIAQRRSREASRKLARAGGASSDQRLETEATSAHDEFIDLYHRLNLDASTEMWKDARGLRRVLDAMLEEARRGDAEDCDADAEVARKARQNLEGSFRAQLGHKPLQKRKHLGEHHVDGD
jgi:hypothetical protein